MAKVWIGSLASYNAGRLYGKWVEVTDTDTMHEEIRELMARDPEHGEEWAIMDTEGLGGLIEKDTDLETVVKVSELIDTYGEALVKGVVEYYGISYLDAAIEDLEENYYGCYESVEDYAYEYYKDTGLLDQVEAISHELASNINWEHIARDWQVGGDIYTIETGYQKVHIFGNR